MGAWNDEELADMSETSELRIAPMRATARSNVLGSSGSSASTRMCTSGP